MVVDSNEVDEEGCATDEYRQQEGTDHHLFDPHLACNIRHHVFTITSSHKVTNLF